MPPPPPAVASSAAEPAPVPPVQATAASASAAPSAPKSGPPSSSVVEIPKAYASRPPVIRDRAPSTVELADEDFVEEPLALTRRSTPPPPPPAKLVAAKRSGPEIPVLVVPQPITVLSEAPPRIAPLPMPLPHIEPHVASARAAAAVAAAPVDPEGALDRDAPPESRVEVRTAGPRLESTLDPMDVLFDGVYEMNFVDTAVEAADVCAAALAKALRARAVVIHAHDLVRRELRTIGVHGASYSALFGSASPSEDDLVASAVFCNEAPVTMRFDGELPRRAPGRLGVVGAPRTLVAVPAMAWGRCVAMIEVFDADDSVAHRVADSAAYVAERLAEFLSERAAA